MQHNNRKEWLASLKVGDIVTRWLGGEIPIDLPVSKFEDGKIYCGLWTFHPETGAEIDEDLGWDGMKITGSYITPKADHGER